MPPFPSPAAHLGACVLLRRTPILSMCLSAIAPGLPFLNLIPQMSTLHHGHVNKRDSSHIRTVGGVRLHK